MKCKNCGHLKSIHLDRACCGELRVDLPNNRRTYKPCDCKAFVMPPIEEIVEDFESRIRQLEIELESSKMDPLT